MDCPGEIGRRKTHANRGAESDDSGVGQTGVALGGGAAIMEETDPERGTHARTDGCGDRIGSALRNGAES